MGECDCCWWLGLFLGVGGLGCVVGEVCGGGLWGVGGGGVGGVGCLGGAWVEREGWCVLLVWGAV